MLVIGAAQPLLPGSAVGWGRLAAALIGWRSERAE